MAPVQACDIFTGSARGMLLALVLMLGGCAGIEMERRSQENQAENNSVYPATYRAEIVALMRTYLNDPTNVREAFVTVPAIRPFGGFERYASCIRYNARTTAGKYAGSKDSVVIFRQGKLERIVDQGRELCKEAVYVPFPELERLTR